MTLSEFKAWFEGFSAGIGTDGLTPDQFTLVKEQLAQVSEPGSIGTPIFPPTWPSPSPILPDPIGIWQPNTAGGVPQPIKVWYGTSGKVEVLQ